MKITFGKTKADIIYYIIAGAALLFGIVFSVINYPETAFVYFLLGMFVIPRFEIKTKTSLVEDLIFPLSSAALAIYFDHLITMFGHEFYEGYHSIIKYLLSHDSFRFQVELFLVIGLYFILRAFFVPSRFAAFISAFPPMLFSLADYYIYTFRGSEFIPPDFYGVKTAFSVVGGYHFPIFLPLAFLALPFFLYVTGMLRLKVEKKEEKWYVREVLAVAAAALFTCGLFHVAEDISTFRTVMMWKDEATRYNGFVTNFAVMLETMRIDEPEGYERAVYEELVTEEASSDISDASNIIVIMNESYTDMRVFSNAGAIDSFEDPMPFWNSLSENTIHGFAYCSVYGGRTPNSEFEFLTGVTTAALPDGAIPYSMYVKSETYSLASYLGDLGYSTLAMHPYLPGGWSRTTVYPLIGFDEMLFIDDFEYDDSDLIREYVSDQCAYENLISQLDRSDKTFTFLITMQNHGGYTVSYDNFPVTEYLPYGGDYGMALNTFLSLIKESDDALEYLIDYLSQQDEKYTLLVFGDHQPNIEVPGDMGYGGNKWMVPYIIWTNYDMPESLQNRDSYYTSLNYLALDVMEAAGVQRSGYYDYINDLRSDIPIINNRGYCDAAGEWHGFDSDTPSVDRYLGLQYYVLFDS